MAPSSHLLPDSPPNSQKKRSRSPLCARFWAAPYAMVQPQDTYTPDPHPPVSDLRPPTSAPTHSPCPAPSPAAAFPQRTYRATSASAAAGAIECKDLQGLKNALAAPADSPAAQTSAVDPDAAVICKVLQSLKKRWPSPTCFRTSSTPCRRAASRRYKEHQCKYRFLWVEDPVAGTSYEHRKQWVLQRLEFLAGQFAVETTMGPARPLAATK